MKRKILAVLLILSMFLSGFMTVDALTTSSRKTEDNVIRDTNLKTAVPYGYHYTIRDYDGNLLKSHNKGFTHSTNGNVGGGMFKYYDSNDNLLFCAELGAQFAKAATSTSQEIFKGTDAACGILKSMAGIDTSYKIGQLGSSAEYTDDEEENITVRITPTELNNYRTNITSYVKIQRAIWKYQNYKGDCKDANGNSFTSYKVKSQDLTNPTLTLPTSGMVELSQDGKNYEVILNVALKNKENLVGDISYAIAAPAKVERISNEKIKVVVPVESYKKGMKLNLTATGKYNDYKNDVYTPVVTVYYFGTVNNVVDGIEQNIQNAQDMATVLLETTTETVQTDLKAQSVLTLTNDPLKVVISKKDVAKEGEVEGAKIVVYNYDETKKEKGEKVVEFTSKKEPFEYDLEPGVYALEETLAPKSYKKLETTFVFKVEADGNVKLLDTYSEKNIITKNNAITIYNEVVVVPDTGSSASIIYIVIGSILLLSGSGLIYLTMKKRKAESI